MKTYVLIISRLFPKTHPRSGEHTYFFESISTYKKKHTIRNNYELWRKRFKKIYAYEACLSVRYWEGKPYRSKQTELFRFYSTDGIGLQKLEITDQGWTAVGNQIVSDIQIAENDGLSKQDFRDWFKDLKPGDEKAIIYFTAFRYLDDLPF